MKTRFTKTKLKPQYKVGKNTVATDRVEVRPDYRRIRITKDLTKEEANLFLTARDQTELQRITTEAKKLIKDKDLPEPKKQELLRAIIQLEQAKTKDKIINWTKRNTELLTMLGATALISGAILRGDLTRPAVLKTVMSKEQFYGIGIPTLLLGTAITIKHQQQNTELKHRLQRKLEKQYQKAGYNQNQTQELIKRDFQKIQGVIE